MSDFVHLSEEAFNQASGVFVTDYVTFVAACDAAHVSNPDMNLQRMIHEVELCYNVVWARYFFNEAARLAELCGAEPEAVDKLLEKVAAHAPTPEKAEKKVENSKNQFAKAAENVMSNIGYVLVQESVRESMKL